MKIIFPVKVYQKFRAYIDNSEDEISGLGKIVRNNNIITILDLKIFTQTTSPAETTLDKKDLGKFYDELLQKGEGLDSWKTWWHCVSSSTPIIMSNGAILKAEEVYKIKNPKIISFDKKDNKFVIAKISNKAKFIAPTFIIKTTLNREIEVTSNHKMLTPLGWKETGQLKIGDMLAIPNKFNLPENIKLPKYIVQGNHCSYKIINNNHVKLRDRIITIPTVLTNDLSELLGWIVSEGNIDKKSHTLHISQKDKKVLYCLQDLLGKIFGVRGEIYQPPVQGRQRCSEIRISGYKAIGNFLYQLGLPNGRNGPKRIPISIFTAPIKFKKTFLEAFIKGDGSLDKRGRILYKRIYTVHKELANDFMYLITMLGYRCGIRKMKQNYPTGRRVMYDVYWNSTDRIRKKIDWVKIKEISPNGKKEVFSFEVPSFKNYLCGFGPFISHNSHAKMNTFFSGTDIATIEDFDNDQPDNNWMLSIVSNHNKDLLARIDIFKPIRCTMNDIDYDIDYSDVDIEREVVSEILEKVNKVILLPKKFDFKKTKLQLFGGKMVLVDSMTGFPICS